MTKYNITLKKNKDAAYRNLVNPELMDRLESQILDIIVKQKKYLDKDYSAKQLAADLGTNSRYISAVINVRFKMNYTSFVNKQRIKDAMVLLAGKENKNLNMEEISDMVGFANRQSFYASFYRINQITPREYKLKEFAKRAERLKKAQEKRQLKREDAEVNLAPAAAENPVETVAVAAE
ncbi:MAG: helix-turn-helix domain-containing protein [Bacteroidales bacterium]|nr:helix-turn-helix domain-containing protein [Bacteroidales bacterium]